MDQDLPAHLIGSPAFFPALITYVRSLSNSPSLPLDQVIVKSVLLCLIAGDKHLILRTPEEDIGLVARLVAWTLASVFGYSTHKVKLRSRTTAPKQLLQSLFLPKGGGHGRLSRTGTKIVLTPRHPRSISYPNDLSQVQSSEQPLTTEPAVHRLLHSLTEPQLPVRKRSELQELPRALILSGLENATSAVQQELARAISEKRVPIGEDSESTLSFPSGFIAVYVCAINGTDRPPIHKSLLDRFSLSHNILIPQSVRLALHASHFSPTQSFSQSPSISHSNPGSPIVSYQPPLPQSQTPPYFTKPLPGSQPPNRQGHPVAFTTDPVTTTFIETLQKHCQCTHLAPELGLYLSDLFAAARHHPRLDGMLLTARARKDAEDLARAARVIGSDPTGMELIRPTDQKADDESEYFDAQSDSRSRYPRTIDDSSTTNLLRNDSMYGGSFTKISSTGLGGTASEDGEEVSVLDVTAVDVARTMPRVVTHRLKLRQGPEDEVLASAVVGATFGPSFVGEAGGNEGQKQTIRPSGDSRKAYGGLTVKDVLVDILNKV